MLQIALLEPEIPPNTGNIARLCLATGTRLHLIGPLGFSLDEKSLRRAGMDYWHECDIRVWNSWPEFQSGVGEGTRLWLFTTKAKSSFWKADYRDGDCLVFGRESKGLPESLLAQHPDQTLRIPMCENARSLNLATSVGIALYESLRQIQQGGGPIFLPTQNP
jgi:tRNA (cytidine/uridine-2'-O-)-methyltransferase